MPFRVWWPICATAIAFMCFYAPELVWPMLAGGALGAVWVPYYRWTKRHRGARK